MELIEEEYTFLVNTMPQLTRIINTEQIGEYSLKKENGIEKINDVYFDTDSGFLTSNNSILRVRFLNEQKLITYKQQLDNNRRIETEVEHSDKEWKKARRRLNVLDKSLGCYHERVVQRKIVKVLLYGMHLCDIDADIVTFRLLDEQDRVDLSRENAYFYEVEIENKSEEKYHDYFMDFVNQFRKKFKLVDWKIPKTATCVIVQDLYKQDLAFRKMIDKKGHLTKNAFYAIEAYSS